MRDLKFRFDTGPRLAMIRKLAFGVGEYALVAEVAILQRLQEEFADRKIVNPNMVEHSGRYVRIRNADEVMGYEFVEIEGRWMEGSIVDPEFCRAENAEWIVRASEVYIAFVPDDDKKFVDVRDQYGCLHLKFRSNNPRRDVEAVNHIASMRCRSSFERKLGFDGDYREEKGGSVGLENSKE